MARRVGHQDDRRGRQRVWRSRGSGHLRHLRSTRWRPSMDAGGRSRRSLLQAVDRGAILLARVLHIFLPGAFPAGGGTRAPRRRPRPVASGPVAAWFVGYISTVVVPVPPIRSRHVAPDVTGAKGRIFLILRRGGLRGHVSMLLSFAASPPLYAFSLGARGVILARWLCQRHVPPPFSRRRASLPVVSSHCAIRTFHVPAPWGHARGSRRDENTRYRPFASAGLCGRRRCRSGAADWCGLVAEDHDDPLAHARHPRPPNAT